jgi:hypothetical protein
VRDAAVSALEAMRRRIPAAPFDRDKRGTIRKDGTDRIRATRTRRLE